MGLFDKLFGKKEALPEQVPPVRLDENKVRLTLAPFRRKAYLPVTEAGAFSFDTRSKMGGYPYLRHAADWPVCPRCSEHMNLFLQLNMNTIPERQSDALVQFFYCTNRDKQCDVDQEGWDTFSENSVCRRIQVAGASAEIRPRIAEIFPERVITGWQAQDDYPHQEEYEMLGIDLGISEELDEFLEREHLEALPGDKLFGWPYWVQSVEYPYDRKTGALMQLLFQIDSEINVPFMWGDSGVGHLTQSPDDADELAFGWACC